MYNRIFSSQEKKKEQPQVTPPAEPEKRRRSLKFTRAEKIALLANGIIWTLAVWVALIIVLLQDGEDMWAWLNAPAPAQAAPLTPLSLPTSSANPTNHGTSVVQPTPTATLVVRPTKTLRAIPATPENVSKPSPVPTTTPLETPALSNPPPQVSTPTVNPPTSIPTETPATATLPRPTATALSELPATAVHIQAEAVAIILPQPSPTTAPAPLSTAETTTYPTPVPWPAPSNPPPPLTSHQQKARPTHLVIEAVGIDSPVVAVGWHTVEQDGQLTSAWEVAEYAIGWHQNSALPGEPGNTILSGHSNISGEVFRYLPEVNQGDRIKVYVGDQIFEYEITETTIVKESGASPEVRRQNAHWIAPTADERLTLVTCWPYPYSTHRFIAVAKPI